MVGTAVTVWAAETLDGQLKTTTWVVATGKAAGRTSSAPRPSVVNLTGTDVLLMLVLTADAGTQLTFTLGSSAL